MLSASGYRDWTTIAYAPARPPQCSADFLDALPDRGAVLDLGCHDGVATIAIAKRRPDLRMAGVDINGAAVASARRRALREGVHNVSFEVCDVLRNPPRRSFDAVLSIRVLTCFPDVGDWNALLDAIERLLSSGALWYCVDYVFDPANAAYAERYAAGERLGWRRGNFQVASPHFIAHHHTEEELELLTRRFALQKMRRFEGRSMHGNLASMFELIAGRRQGRP